MKRALVGHCGAFYSALAAILVAAAILAAAPQRNSGYRPAAVISATGLQPPANSIAMGVAALDISVDATGAVAGVNVLRDLPPVTHAAKSAVQSWKFTPAGSGADSLPSDLLAAFILPPAASFPGNPNFPRLLPKAGSNPGYALPGIVSVAYAAYPANSVVSGSVIVQVTVGPDGNATAWQVLQSLEPCTHLALEAAHKWRFLAATFEGQPVPSKIAIDFLFLPPISNPY